MCGRFVQSQRSERLAERYGVDLVLDGDIAPTWNAAPGQDLPVVLRDAGGRRVLRRLRWGLSPAWARRPLINARAEDAPRKPTFRHAWRARRCLVPADGFYEWRRTPQGREPLFFSCRGRPLVAMAGLWEPADEAGGRFAVLTVTANAVVAPIHGRMPAILAPADEERWLDPAAAPDELNAAAAPCPAEETEARTVAPLVNDVRRDGPELIAAVAGAGPRQTDLFAE